jgi:hypothetical protein
MVAPSGTQKNWSTLLTDREAPLPQPNKSSSASPEYVTTAEEWVTQNHLSHVQHVVQMGGTGLC